MLSKSTNLPPHVTKRVAKELGDLVRDPIEGIKLNHEDELLTEIKAEINGPEGTPYEGGTFRVKLVLGSTFPSQPPKGYFLTQIFHPNVGPSGEICVNTLKRDWSSDHKLKHILIVIRCLLIHPNPDSALNEEAGHLLSRDFDEFYKRAQLYTSIHAMRSNTAPEESSRNFQKENVNSGQIQETPKRRKVRKRKKPKKTLRRL